MDYRIVKKIHRLITIFAILMFSCACVTAQEPDPPDVNIVFDDAKEAKIKELSQLSLQFVIERLKSDDFLYNEDELNKAVFTAFKDRKEEAIDYALKNLDSPRVQVIEGKLINRSNDLYIAKKIFQVFPEESVDIILRGYTNSSPIKKGNIVQVLGNVAAGQAVKDLLVSSLDDKTFCEEENPEMQGEPMRICDVAYNQLVLRYQIKDVLRTIGPAHTLEQRDYHIEVIKNKL